MNECNELLGTTKSGEKFVCGELNLQRIIHVQIRALSVCQADRNHYRRVEHLKLFTEDQMDLFHCVSTEKFEAGNSRAKSEERERDPVAPPRAVRRTSLHNSARKLSASK